MGKVFRIITLLSSITAVGLTVSAQDLGTSNKLFGKSTSAVPKTEKKTPARPKSVTKPSATRSGTSKKAAAKTHTSLPKGRTDSTKSEPKAAAKTDLTANRLYETLIETGNRARDQRDYKSALAAYNRARETRKSDSRAMCGLGNIYSDQQRWEDAEASYRSALTADPGIASIYIALSYVLTQPVAAPNLSARYSEAERLARKALQLDGNNAIAYDRLGVALELQGQLGSETERNYRRAIEILPSFAPAHAHLGRLLRRKGKSADAARAYKDAISNVNDIMTLVMVAEVLQSELRYADSLPLLKRAVINDPDNLTALNLLGRALMATGSRSEAESVLKKAAAVGSDSFLTYSMLGELYTRQGRLDAAEKALMSASKFASTFEKAELAAQFEALGDGYLKSGNSAGAGRAFRKALSFAPERESIAAKVRRVSKG